MVNIDLTERELAELKWCMMYFDGSTWGTDGHNRMILVAKLALSLGFVVVDGEFYTPDETRPWDSELE